MEQYFAVMFEDVTQERSFILVLSSTDPDILRQSKLTDLETDIIKNLTSSTAHFERTQSHVFTRITIRIDFLFIK